MLFLCVFEKGNKNRKFIFEERSSRFKGQAEWSGNIFSRSYNHSLLISRQTHYIRIWGQIFFFFFLFLHSPTWNLSIMVFCLFVCFLGQHPRHMEVPRLGVKLELQPLAYATVTARQDLSRICNLYHSSQQRQIFNPLSEARHRTCVLMDASRVSQPLSHDGNSCQ